MSQLFKIPFGILSIIILFCFSSVISKPQARKTNNPIQNSTEAARDLNTSSTTILPKDILKSAETKIEEVTESSTFSTTEIPNSQASTTKSPTVTAKKSLSAGTTPSEKRTTPKPSIASTTTTEAPTTSQPAPKSSLKSVKSSVSQSRSSAIPSGELSTANKTDDAISSSSKENDNVKSLIPGRAKDFGAITGGGDFADIDDEEVDPTFRLKEPGFGTPKPRPPVTTPASTSEDKRIRKEWGGNCLAQHWEHCSRVTGWGGAFFIPDKEDPHKDPNKRRKIPMYRRLDCTKKEEQKRTVCLRNGWTVSICTILCMAQCNRDMLYKWESFVSQPGECPVG